jgi:hypothetical protein
MNPLRKLSFLSLASLWLFSCQSEAEKRELLEKKISKQLLIATNSSPKSLKVSETPDAGGVYFVETELENGRQMQFAAKLFDDSVAFKETFNSQLAWTLTQEMGAKCLSLVLRPIENSKELTGTAVISPGDTLKFFAEEGRGWRPAKDLNTLTYLTKKQIGNGVLADTTDRIAEFVLAPDSVDGIFRGHFTSVKNPIKTNIKVKWTTERFDWELQ